MKQTTDMKFSYSSQFTKRGELSLHAKQLFDQIKGFNTIHSSEYIEQIEVLRTAFDANILLDARAMAERMNTSTLKVIFIVGIGGSSLGTKAIVDALYDNNRNTKIIFLESLHDRSIKQAEEICSTLRSSHEFCINIISKAGATTETIANFSILSGFVEHIDGWRSRVVVTTTKESELAALSKKEGYALLYMPKVISGRYSVFTAVGVFPLFLAGYPVQEILAGAQDAHALLQAPHDPTRRLVEDLVGGLSAGMHIIDFFFFNSELESLGKWARQLYAESLGKTHDKNGKEVHTGITPTVSIGSEDLHSMVQLYYGGPRDRISLLIPPLKGQKHIIPSHAFTALVPGIAGRSTDDVNEAIYTGVVAAFKANQIASVEVLFPSLGGAMVGAFMQWQMQVVAILAEHLNISAFDQPNVEDYKKVTHSLLVQK